MKEILFPYSMINKYFFLFEGIITLTEKCLEDYVGKLKVGDAMSQTFTY